MDTVERRFEKFVDFLEGEADGGRPIPDFGEVCEMLGIPRAELNAFLEETYGIDGDGIVACYRTSTPIDMMP